MKRYLSIVLTHVGVVAVICLFWELATRDARARFLFGSPSGIARAAVEDLASGRLWVDISATATVAVAGLLIGTVVGATLGFLIWVHPHLARFFRPYIFLAAAVPIFALAPMLIIWFGVGVLPKVVMAAFSVSLVSLVGTYELARRAHAEHDEWMTGLAMSRWQRLRFVIAPIVTEGILAMMARSVGVSFIGTFIGEFIASQNGLGRYILRAGGLYDMPRVSFGILLFALLSLALSLIISYFAGSRHRAPVLDAGI